jgi:hypothetical protein
VRKRIFSAAVSPSCRTPGEDRLKPVEAARAERENERVTLKHLSLACFLVGCSGPSAVLRSDEPLPGAWLQVAMLVTGSESSDDKFDRCVRTARDHGIWVHAQAPIKLVFSLDTTGNRITIGRYGSPPVRDEIRPQWSMQALCLSGLTMAAEVAGRNVAIMKTDPGPGCVMRGAVEGKSTASFTPATYEEAVGDAMLRAAQQGMNYLSMDAVEKRSAQILISGRGFICSGTAPGIQRATEDE